MIRHRPLAVIAGVLLAMVLAVSAPLSDANASSAAANSTGPHCAPGPVTVTWETGYDQDRYEVHTVHVDGLQACAGGALSVTISGPDQPLVHTAARVGADAVALDLRAHHIPAHSVAHLSLALTVHSAEGAGPVQVQPENDSTDAQGSAAAVDGPASPALAPAAMAPGLAATGIRVLWVLLAAATVIGLGALLRRRDQQERHV